MHCAGRIGDGGKWVCGMRMLQGMKHCLVYSVGAFRISGVIMHCAGRIGDGGKWVCGMRMLQEMKHCLVYSLGSQGDTSFEDEFLDRTICEVCSTPSLPLSRV